MHHLLKKGERRKPFQSRQKTNIMSYQNCDTYNIYCNFAHYSWRVYLMYDDGNGSWVKVDTGLHGLGTSNSGGTITRSQILALIPADANFFFYMYVEAGADEIITYEGSAYGFGSADTTSIAIFNCSAPNTAPSAIALYSYGSAGINKLSFVQHVN